MICKSYDADQKEVSFHMFSMFMFTTAYTSCIAKLRTGIIKMSELNWIM